MGDALPAGYYIDYLLFVAFGVYGLSEMKKNEFPDFTIRQGVVAAVYPGATAAEMEEQVAKPLENYIFSYKEVKKAKTHSTCKDGMVIIQVQLNDDLNNKDEFWSKFKHGVGQFKSELPQGVLAVQVMDDFGDTSALLVTMESGDKSLSRTEHLYGRAERQIEKDRKCRTAEHVRYAARTDFDLSR